MANQHYSTTPKRTQAKHIKLQLSDGRSITFDSKHEFEVYRAIKDPLGYYQLFGKDNGIELKTQVPVTLVPPSEGYRATKWRCDFSLVANEFKGKQGSDYYYPLYLEAKSYYTALDELFRLQLKALSFNSPEVFSNLWIVLPAMTPATSVLDLSRKLGTKQVVTIPLLDSLIKDHFA